MRGKVGSEFHLLYMKPIDNHDVEDKNIISVVGSLAIAGQISLFSNANLKPKLAIMRQWTSVTDRQTDRQTNSGIVA